MNVAARRNLYVGLFCIGILPYFINGVVNSLIFRRPWLYWSFEVLTWLIIPAAVFAVALRNGLRFVDLGLHTQIRGRRNIAVLLVLCLIAGPIEMFVYKQLLAFFTRIIPGTPLFDYSTIVPAHGLMRVLIPLYFGITAAFVEEMYFRGFFFKISEFFLAPRLVYLGLSPLLFALIHWEGASGNIPATFVLGFLAALSYVAIRNLWPLIIGHIYTDYMWFQT